jgi:hypothetical protein
MGYVVAYYATSSPGLTALTSIDSGTDHCDGIVVVLRQYCGGVVAHPVPIPFQANLSQNNSRSKLYF